MGGSGIKDLFGGAEKEQQIKKDEKISTRNWESRKIEIHE
jgi:hypothetical protein